jgi:hypothetical protein
MGLRRISFVLACLGVAVSAFGQGRFTTPTSAGKSAAALDRLRAEAPGVQVMRKGTKVSRVYGPAFGSGFTPEQSAVAFVNEYADVFEPGTGALHYAGSQDVMDGKFTAVYFNEFAGAAQVYGGHLTVLVRNEVGCPIVLASSSVQTVSLERSLRQMSGSAAVAVVRKAEPTLSLEGQPVMVAWPGETTTKMAWSFVVGNGKLEDPRRLRAFVDSATGAILEWRDEVYFVDVTGNVKGWMTPGVLPNQASNPAVLQNLVDTTARVVAGNSTKTNLLGNFTIVHGGVTNVDVQSELLGTWANVNNTAGSDEMLTMNVLPPGPANFVFNAAKTEFVQAQVDGFVQTQIVHNFAKAINASYPGIDIAIPVNVNINSSCNAYYTNSTINFYRAGGGCPNTSYSSVVHHEYGHFIIEMGHPTPTGDFHEGMADVNAAFLLNDPCLGRDFLGAGSGCLRNTYNGVTHPCGGEVHLCGQVISGAFWLTKDQLDATMGAGPALDYSRELYLNSILLHPPDIDPGMTVDVLTLDDDDANIFNGTPHYDEIAAGFGAKKLYAPVINWLTITPVTLPGEFVQLPHGPFIFVSVNIADDIGTLNPATPRLVWRVNGGVWQERIMPRLSSSSPFHSYFETPTAGSIVEWYVKAVDTQGHVVTYPNGAFNITMVGNSLTTPLFDTFETNLGWSVVNDASLLTGAWVRANPNGTVLDGRAANPENDSGDSGTICAFTGQGTAGGPVGEADVDGGPTRFVSPVFDLSGGNGVVDFSWWFFNDDGDDSFTVELSNNGGSSWTVVHTTLFTGDENSWKTLRILVGNVMARTNNMRVRVTTSDNPNDSITEAAIDAFRVRRLQ